MNKLSRRSINKQNHFSNLNSLEKQVHLGKDQKHAPLSVFKIFLHIHHLRKFLLNKNLLDSKHNRRLNKRVLKMAIQLVAKPTCLSVVLMNLYLIFLPLILYG